MGPVGTLAIHVPDERPPGSGVWCRSRLGEACRVRGRGADVGKKDWIGTPGASRSGSSERNPSARRLRRIAMRMTGIALMVAAAGILIFCGFAAMTNDVQPTANAQV